LGYTGKLGRARNIQHLAFNDGSQYTGQVEDGMKNGMGMLLVHDGSAYLGDWFNDNYHGHGIYIHPDGERYDG